MFTLPLFECPRSVKHAVVGLVAQGGAGFGVEFRVVLKPPRKREGWRDAAEPATKIAP
jgi:hypothetical protein